MRKPFKETKIGKLVNSKVGNIVKGLVVEGLQTLPVVGTIVTNIKTDTPENPKGSMKLGKPEAYRIAIGLVIAILLAKGIFTESQIDTILKVIGM